MTSKPTFATVATSGLYSDLQGKPNLFSGSYKDLTNKPDSIELQTAIEQLPGLVPPLLTTFQIDALHPSKPTLVVDVTLGVLKLYIDGKWKIFATVN